MTREQTMAQPETGAVGQSTGLAGRRFQVRDHYEVGREKVREFARAVQNHHGAHQREPDARKLGYEGLIAPPTFASVIGMASTRALLDSVLTDYDLTQVLQTDQVFEMRRPILAGDRMQTEVLIDSLRQFGDNDFIHVKFVLRNQHGEIAQVGSSTIVARRGADVDPNLVEAVESIFMHVRPSELDETGPLAELPVAGVPLDIPAREPALVHTLPAFEELSPGTALPAGSARLTRGDLANYAGVSGDPNPIHFSDRAAELVGLPTVVAHGMLTMGLAADYLTSWLGDPTAIEKFSVRFSGFVPVAADAATTVDFSGKIKSLDAGSRTGTIMLSGAADGRKLFGRALAEVRFA
ncbi:fused (3R)-hydroxyacyl-ACP dehydratase subunits HadA/HadB [Nocardia goodfellowii]|uniref:Acyl dehydratase n=1 Tax=Nocardia goodfellowii TaxID=882446 RepID=A0ABS4QCW5_9NOCA|nr:fused (3R)-hydroxyacyl-ACP dehydratase subunits HadA/HadB [Nocardia goodfellowii]MBP2188546.1 acyl dehydratase [Nocardia goodfellowii]